MITTWGNRIFYLLTLFSTLELDFLVGKVAVGIFQTIALVIAVIYPRNLLRLLLRVRGHQLCLTEEYQCEDLQQNVCITFQFVALICRILCRIVINPNMVIICKESFASNFKMSLMHFLTSNKNLCKNYSLSKEYRNYFHIS